MAVRGRPPKWVDAVTTVLVAADAPLRVDDVYLAVVTRQVGPRPDRATLHRILRRLVVQGRAVEVLIEVPRAYFEIAGERHDHTWCERCQRINCLPGPDETTAVTAAEAAGFRSRSHQTLVLGLCRVCHERAAAAAG